MAKERRTITLDRDADELLERTGNASAYLSALVRLRWQEWRDALEVLRASGWSRGELLSAMDALNGVHLLGLGRAPAAVAGELHDYARLSGLRPEWDVSPERWAERARTVAEREDLARGLVSLATEFWIGNDDVARALEGGK